MPFNALDVHLKIRAAFHKCFEKGLREKEFELKWGNLMPIASVPWENKSFDEPQKIWGSCKVCTHYTAFQISKIWQTTLVHHPVLHWFSKAEDLHQNIAKIINDHCAKNSEMDKNGIWNHGHRKSLSQSDEAATGSALLSLDTILREFPGSK